MSASIGGVTVYLTDDTSRFQTGMRQAASLVEQSSARMRTATASAEKSVRDLGASTRGFAPDAFRSLSLSALKSKSDVEALRSAILAVPALAGGFGGAIVAQQLTQRADAYTNLKNRIASVVEGQREQISAERGLYEVAQRTRSSLQTNASLFARLRSSSPQLAADGDKLLRTVETVQKSFLVGGATTQEAQSSALQLAQALGSGRLQGDELRSILENNIPLAKLIAQEFGVGIGQLKELGSEGTLTSDRVVKAILDGSNEIDTIFARLKPTFQQSLQVLDNSLTRTIGKFDEATGLSSGLARGVIGVANNLDSLAQSGLYAAAAVASVFAGRALSSAGGAVKDRFGAERDARSASAAAAQEAVRAATQQRLDLQQRVGFLQDELSRGIDTDAPRQKAEAALRKQEAALANSNDRLQKLADQRDRILAGGRGNLDRIDTRFGVEQERNLRLQGQVAGAGQNLQRVQSDPGAQALAERTRLSQQLITTSAQLGAANRDLAAATLAADAASSRATVSASAMGAALGAVRSVGSSLFGFLGGPWGVALTVVSGAMAAYGISVANAAAEQARFKANSDGIPDLLNRIAAASKQGLGNSLKADVNATVAIATQAQTVAATDFGLSLRSIDETKIKDVNAALGVTHDAFRGARLALSDYASQQLQTKDGTDRLKSALEALSAARPDLSPAIAEMLRVLGVAAATANQVNALRNALAGASNGQVVGRKSAYDGLSPEEKINEANKPALDAARTTVDLIDEQNRKLEVQAGIGRRLSDAARDKRELRRVELQDQILADSRRSGAGLTPEEALRNARQIEEIENATSNAGKKGGGGGGGRKGFTSEERFDNKVQLLREQGRAAFFTDLDRELIAQLKELKSDPGLAKRTTDAIISGGELPERAKELRAALELKKSGELAREAKQQYGSLADVLPLVAERERLLNIAVQEGQLSREAATKALAAYAQTLPQVQKAREGSDRLVDGFGEIGWAAFEGGAKKAREALRSLALEMAKTLAQAAVLKPLKDFIAGGVTGSSGSGGGLSGFLSGITGLFGGGSSATGGLYPTASAAAVRMHSGGIVGMHGTPISVPAAAFAGARRYHSGLKPSEFAAVLEKGEAVLTQRHQAGVAAMASGVGAVNMRQGDVIINDYAGAKPTVRRDSSGRTVVDIMDSTNARGVSRGMRGQGAFADAFPNEVRAGARVG